MPKRQPQVQERFRRTTVLGDAKVGKTELVRRLIYEIELQKTMTNNKKKHHHRVIETDAFVFKTPYVATVEDYFVVQMKLKEILFLIEIIDTSGTEQFPAMRKLNIEKSDFLVILYDPTSHTSVKEAKRLYKIAREIRPPESKLLIIFVCGKADLLPGKSDSYEDEFENIFNEETLIRNIECSAQTGSNIQKVFEIGLQDCIPQGDENTRLERLAIRQYLKNSMSNV